MRHGIDNKHIPEHRQIRSGPNHACGMNYLLILHTLCQPALHPKSRFPRRPRFDRKYLSVAWWKLRDRNVQAEHGNQAPTVVKHRTFGLHNFNQGASVSDTAARGIRQALFGAALEQLAQMCGSFLTATADTPVKSVLEVQSTAGHLSIIIQVSDALDFCDALSAASFVATPGIDDGLQRTCTPRVDYAPVAFSQGTLQPLKLRKDAFAGSEANFDVINTSNLADNLGERFEVPVGCREIASPINLCFCWCPSRGLKQTSTSSIQATSQIISVNVLKYL